jgi:PEP-CTERM motif-containing protein
MHLKSQRALELAVCLFTLATPAFCAVGCTVPEPGTFWLAGLGVSAVLLVRRMRAKK